MRYVTRRMNLCWPREGEHLVFFDNMDYMNQEGTTVFLNTSSLVIVDRLKRQRANRPLLAMYSDDELEFFVREHLESRLPFYLKAKEQV